MHGLNTTLACCNKRHNELRQSAIESSNVQNLIMKHQTLVSSLLKMFLYSHYSTIILGWGNCTVICIGRRTR